MHHIMLALVLFSAVAYADGKATTYIDNSKTVAHDCSKQPEAVVAGNSNTITFTGKCTKIDVAGNTNTLTIESAAAVMVAGNDNTIAVDAADKIGTPGNNNKVSWKKGIAAKAPAISNPGTKNSISQAKAK